MDKTMDKTIQQSNQWMEIIQFFFLGCFLGFIWEIAFYCLTHLPDANLITILTSLRGFLHGPWVPIYGVGGILMLAIRTRFPRKPFLFFLSSMVSCGIVEFAASWILEQIFHARWWDYSDKFMNLDGRIYLNGLLFFGLAGYLAVYLLEPVFQKWTQRLPFQYRKLLCMGLCILFIVDVLYSLAVPNLGIGVLLTK